MPRLPRPRTSQLFPVILMLGLALATLWLERLVQLPDANKSATKRHEPDYIVHGFTVTRMDAQGHPQSSLTARTMTHFADDESTELVDPHFVQRTVGKPQLDVTSKRGKLSKDGETIWLNDDVVGVRAADGDQLPLRMETTAMEIDPRKETGKTNELVVLTQGTRRLEGVGMDVDAKARVFEFRSQVRGSYLAPKDRAPKGRS